MYVHDQPASKLLVSLLASVVPPPFPAAVSQGLHAAASTPESLQPQHLHLNSNTKRYNFIIETTQLNSVENNYEGFLTKGLWVFTKLSTSISYCILSF